MWLHRRGFCTSVLYNHGTKVLWCYFKVYGMHLWLIAVRVWWNQNFHEITDQLTVYVHCTILSYIQSVFNSIVAVLILLLTRWLSYNHLIDKKEIVVQNESQIEVICLYTIAKNLCMPKSGRCSLWFFVLCSNGNPASSQPCNKINNQQDVCLFCKLFLGPCPKSAHELVCHHHHLTSWPSSAEWDIRS